MKRIYQLAAMAICLMGLPGCGHVIRWAESNFDQGEILEPVSKVPRNYLRSAYIHRQFSTVALIDALWLSDEVRTVYAQTYGVKNGKNEQMTKAFLRRQLEENKHFISFYVLTNFSLNIGDQNNTWAFFLTVGETTVAPNEIRVTELTPEFKAFFGKCYNRFKSIYLVKFNAKTPDGKPLITEDAQTMDLHFRSIEKEAILSWQVNVPALVTENNEEQEVTEIPETVPAPEVTEEQSVPEVSNSVQESAAQPEATQEQQEIQPVMPEETTMTPEAPETQELFIPSVDDYELPSIEEVPA
ncbi:MAG: hypothetical protein ACHQVS_02025 [Candidatus Babeliales bacterium]